VTLLFPTANRADARTYAEAITGVSHASAFAAGTDYTGGTASRVCVHLSVNEDELTYAIALRKTQPSICKMIIRDSNWVVQYSDISEVAVDSTVRDAALRTAMQATFTEEGDTSTVTDSHIIWDLDWYVKTTTDPLPGFVDPQATSVFIYAGTPGREVVTLALRDDGGTYYGAEIKKTVTNGYGTYRFSTAGRINNLGSNVTYGAFNYASGADGGVDPFEEGGYEFGGVTSTDTCQSYYFRDDTLAVDATTFDPGTGLIHHFVYTWTADRIDWAAYNRAGTLIHSDSATTAIDDFIGATWRFNAWAFTGIPSAESRLSFFDFSFTPA
jgi:hypothetical protein